MNFSLKPFRQNLSHLSGHTGCNNVNNQTPDPDPETETETDISTTTAHQQSPSPIPEFISGNLHRDSHPNLPTTGASEANALASTLAVTFNPIETSSLIWPKGLQHVHNWQRQDGLWESTCFECFIGLTDQETYIEINVSPDGHWQAYLFSSYRQSTGICHDVALTGHSSNTTNGVSLMSFQVDIQHPDFVTADWEISVSTVLEFPNNDLRYYASRHMGSRPDFHLSALRDLTVPAI